MRYFVYKRKADILFRPFEHEYNFTQYLINGALFFKCTHLKNRFSCYVKNNDMLESLNRKSCKKVYVKSCLCRINSTS